MLGFATPSHQSSALEHRHDGLFATQPTWKHLERESHLVAKMLVLRRVHG